MLAGVAATALSVPLAACGGGTFGGGIGGSGVVFGVIEGIGSIIVDGIAFDTSGAEITINGEAADIRRNVLVRVVGRPENGRTIRADRMFELAPGGSAVGAGVTACAPPTFVAHPTPPMTSRTAMSPLEDKEQTWN